MPKVNSTVKSVRIDNATLSELERRLGGQSINSWLNEQIESYLSGGKPHIEKNTALMDIEQMASLSGMRLDEVIEEIDRLMNEGVLQLHRERITVEKPAWVERFEEACHEKCLDVEKVVENAIKAIQRGTL